MMSAEASSPMSQRCLSQQLTGEVAGGLLPGAARVDFAPGDVLPPAEDEALMLIEGELLRYRDGRLVDIVEAPAELGLAEALSGASSPDRLKARTAGALARIPGPALREALAQSPALRERVIAHLARAAVARDRGRDGLLRSFDDFFSPEPGGRLLPGPYRFDPFRALQLVMEASPRALDTLLPEGLSRIPGLGGRYLVVINDFRSCVCEHAESERRAYAYQEVVPFIPCVSRAGTAGMFTPELYASAYMPILLGRETYGFPKRMGRVRLGPRRVDLLVDDDVLLHARWAEETALRAGDFAQSLAAALFSAGAPGAPLARLLGGLVDLTERAGLVGSAPAAAAPRRSLPLRSRVFVRKRVRAPESLDLDRYALDELVEVPFDVFHVGDLARLTDARVEVPAGSRIFPGRVVAGFSCTMGFRMGTGRVQRRYAPAPARKGLFARLASGSLQAP